MYPILTLQSIEKTLKNRFKEGFLNLSNLPQPKTFKDMEKASKRVAKAIEKKEKITIIGDYDVDGVVSTTIMKLFFNEINYPIEWIIPNRFSDGYGLSKTIIPKIKGTDLAITVDNGISAYEASLICQKEGIELIITDHHLIPKNLPKAYAIIDQKQESCNFPYDEVCGAQIAWYFIASIKNELNIKIDMLYYLELVSIAIIADIMPLIHINRAMVIKGLELLSKSKKPSIKAFLEHIDKESLNSQDVAFFLAPILNSAGRIVDASFAVDFLLSTNIYDARVRLQKLIYFNNERKEIEKNITKEALSKVDKNESINVVYGEDWHEGVLGIVSARISQENQKPSIVLTKNKEYLKGSGRSYGDCNLFSVVNSTKKLLTKFGGHHSAIGLMLEKKDLNQFKQELEKSFKEKYKEIIFKDKELIGELDFNLITFELIQLLKKYEPFGEANPTPKFISKNVKIVEIDKMGKDGEHLRFIFSQNGIIHKGVQFKTDNFFNKGDKVEVIYKLNENHFRGNITIQLMVEKIILGE